MINTNLWLNYVSIFQVLRVISLPIFQVLFFETMGSLFLLFTYAPYTISSIWHIRVETS